LLTSVAARDAVALAAAAADSIGDASSATTKAADAASSHVAKVGRANHPPTRASASALHSLLCALAPTAADSDGGVSWVACATHVVDACLGKDEVCLTLCSRIVVPGAVDTYRANTSVMHALGACLPGILRECSTGREQGDVLAAQHRQIKGRPPEICPGSLRTSRTQQLSPHTSFTMWTRRVFCKQLAPHMKAFTPQSPG
jgi:hypothetical protein